MTAALASMPRFSVSNKSRQVLVASDVERTRGPWARMRGLLGRSREQFTPGMGLWITPSQGVHTVGMSFPIDVVYLDGGSRVIVLYHRLAPHRLARVTFRARSVLELPAGTLERTGTELGDTLEFKETKDEMR